MKERGRIMKTIIWKILEKVFPFRSSLDVTFYDSESLHSRDIIRILRACK